LTPWCWNNGYTKIVFLLAGFHPDPPVVRNAPLSDIEAGHDLQARNNRIVKLPKAGRHLDVLQNPVDPVAEFDRRLVWLDVDIRRVEPQRFEQDLVDEVRHRAVHRRGTVRS